MNVKEKEQVEQISGKYPTVDVDLPYINPRSISHGPRLIIKLFGLGRPEFAGVCLSLVTDRKRRDCPPGRHTSTLNSLNSQLSSQLSTSPKVTLNSSLLESPIPSASFLTFFLLDPTLFTNSRCASEPCIRTSAYPTAPLQLVRYLTRKPPLNTLRASSNTLIPYFALQTPWVLCSTSGVSAGPSRKHGTQSTQQPSAVLLM